MTNPRITFSGSASVLFIVLLTVIVRSASPSADARRAEASGRRSAEREGGSLRGAASTRSAGVLLRGEAAFLNQYCIACHNQRAKIGGLALDTLDIARVGPASETWEKVVKKIRTGMMPPSGAHASRAQRARPVRRPSSSRVSIGPSIQPRRW